MPHAEPLGTQRLDVPCGHGGAVTPHVHAGTPGGCAECLASGSRWVHLRLCLTCGHVGCCDSSPERHATGHFHATRHPLMASWEPGEGWGWCFVDEVDFDARPVLREAHAAARGGPGAS